MNSIDASLAGAISAALNSLVDLGRVSAGILARVLGVERPRSITSCDLARCAGPNFLPTSTASKRHAREPAGPFPALVPGPVCLSLSDAGRSDVYCFTVPDTGNFALANGMIASQCADSVRYAAMSRPWMAGKPPVDLPIDGMEALTLDRLWEEHAADRSNAGRRQRV